MAKKKDLYYFETFAKSADCACQAAKLLGEVIADFNPEELPTKIQEIHLIEHAGDELNHGVMAALTTAFITPIEREDIMNISSNLDEIIDFIEDVVLSLYMYNVRAIKPEAHKFIELLQQSCELVEATVAELVNFKKSKELKNKIIEINRLEGEGDELYIESMHKLHTSDDSPLAIIAWKEILKCLERCLDQCEDTAGLIEGVIMKNT